MVKSPNEFKFVNLIIAIVAIYSSTHYMRELK